MTRRPADRRRARRRGARVPRARRDDRRPRVGVQFHTRVAVNVLGIVRPRAGRSARSSTRPERAGRTRCSATTATPTTLERELARGDPRRRARRPRPELSARPRARDTCGEKLADRQSRLPPETAGVASRPHADRDLERQLAEGPAPPRRGVPRLRRRRRALPAGDEAQPTRPSRALTFSGARLRVGAQRPRASGTVSRSSRASGSTTSPTASATRTSIRTRATRGSSRRLRRHPRSCSVYVPNGREVPTRVLRPQARVVRDAARLARARPRPDEPLVVLGDFNVAPDRPRRVGPEGVRRRDPRDASPNVTRSPQLEEWGLRRHLPPACIPTPTGSTRYWDYRAGDFHQHRGMRIDLVLATQPGRRARQRGPSSTATRARAPALRPRPAHHRSRLNPPLTSPRDRRRPSSRRARRSSCAASSRTRLAALAGSPMSRSTSAGR